LSHHLDILKRAELVIDTRRWQYIYYSLNMSVVEELMQGLYEFIHKDT
jgi:DNA-binding transcriptional ArsR family regulator